MSESENYKKIRKFCINWGADLFGVADISSLKENFALKPRIIDTFNSAVCLGVRVGFSVLDEIDCQPTKLYFHHYRTLNMFLDQLTLRASNYIQGLGYRALAIPASQIVDWEKQTAHLSHKHIGRLAGLGWLGKNNLLVNKRLGSQFRISSILTDIPIKTNKPLKEDCGKCRLCMVICPAQAIKEKASSFDHMSCFAKLREFQKNKIVDQFICGVCVKACRGKNAGN